MADWQCKQQFSSAAAMDECCNLLHTHAVFLVLACRPPKPASKTTSGRRADAPPQRVAYMDTVEQKGRNDRASNRYPHSL